GGGEKRMGEIASGRGGSERWAGGGGPGAAPAGGAADPGPAVTAGDLRGAAGGVTGRCPQGGRRFRPVTDDRLHGARVPPALRPGTAGPARQSGLVDSGKARTDCAHGRTGPTRGV